MEKTRTLFAVIFAILGGLLSVQYMPFVLERLYLTVERIATSPIDVDGQVFAPTSPRSPFALEESSLTAREDAEAAADDGEAGVVSQEDLQQGLEEQPAGDTEAPTVDEASVEGVTTTLPPVNAAPTTPPVAVPTNEIVFEGEAYPPARYPVTLVALFLLGAIVGGGVGNALAARMIRAFGRWDRMESGDKVTLFLGIFMGIVASIPFLFVLQGLGNLASSVTTLALTVGFSALAIYMLNSMKEVLPWQKEFGTRRKSGIRILDTSVIIDGRIYDVVKAGFLIGDIYIPNFVLKELQHIADSPDSLRRQRGRRGLEILRLLQAEYTVQVGDLDKHAGDDKEEVDHRLIRLAKAIGGDVVTNDFNLNRVASLQDVRVLNVNDLALALRPSVLPGETLNILISREGNQPGQGVGYLDDGTMIVVESGREFIGQEAEVAVTQIIQTERGKMIFAEVPFPEDEHGSTDARSNEDFSTRRRRSTPR